MFLFYIVNNQNNTVILHIFFNVNLNAIMSRFIEYSNNIFFDVMLLFGEMLNEETRCSKCVHPFLGCIKELYTFKNNSFISLT